MPDLPTFVVPIERMDAVLNVRLTAAERDAVRRWAMRRGVSMSEAVRTMVGAYLGTDGGAAADFARDKRIAGLGSNRAERSLYARVAKSRE